MTGVWLHGCMVSAWLHGCMVHGSRQQRAAPLNMALPLSSTHSSPLAPACLPRADMDGFKLLETVGLELDLPVISES
jgi:hypothetical protein